MIPPSTRAATIRIGKPRASGDDPYAEAVVKVAEE